MCRIERNTAGVGVASKLCTEKAVNPEIGALTQHQDAALENAGALNKAITLELAKQLAGIGADSNLALLSGTFAPGDVSVATPRSVSIDADSFSPSDSTGKGSSCDAEEPDLGCIFSEKLVVLDAAEEEISSSVAGVAQTFTGTGGISAIDLIDLGSFSVASVTGNVDLATIVKGGSGDTTGAASGVATGSAGDASGISSTSAAAAVTNDAGGNNSNSAVDVAATTAVEATTAEGCAVVTTAITPVAPSKQAACSTIVKTVAADATSAVLATLTSATVGQVTSVGVNIQSFTAILGGPPPPVVSSAGDRPFSVNGNTFTDAGAALSRSCDTQHNAYANAANSRQLAGGTAQCDTQSSGC